MDDIGSSNLFLAMVRGFNYAFLRVCLMKVYPSALSFSFGSAVVGKSTSPILDTNGFLKNPTCCRAFWQYITMPAAP